LFHPHDLDDRPAAAVAPRRRSEPLRLLSVGEVNSNKRVGDVVEMLARRPDLAARVRYDVIGELHDSLPHTPELRERIAAIGLQDSVHLHGRLGDRELAAALRGADVHVNLRLPAFEGASGSLVRQLASAAPVVVYATGSFAELPDDVAVKVAPGDVDALGAAIVSLLDPDTRAAIGQRGAAYVAALTPRRYAEGLAAFLVEAASRDPLLALAERAGRQLAALATDPGDAAVAAVERELRALERQGPAPRDPVDSG
jgi:glycosyltransferase involved in cell wall biosynthesis